MVESKDLNTIQDPRSNSERVLRASETCERLGTGGQVIFQSDQLTEETSWNLSCLRKAMKELREVYLPDYEFGQAMTLVGTLGKTIKITETDDEDDAWVIMWITHSRPFGVRVLPVSKVFFHDPSFDPRRWTMVVFWEETTGRSKRQTVRPPSKTSKNPPSSNQPEMPDIPPATVFKDPNSPIYPENSSSQQRYQPPKRPTDTQMDDYMREPSAEENPEERPTDAEMDDL